ncbi:acyltransferase family protein [Pseudarthrobacter sp. NamE5]|uniref:acyltransferase family protein n=1 Tax=Pseudarthrobacter sp. NamE5 TaxID=2576839 RepID=UPI00110AE70F|nr:acyltransferase family protein [Pseudarthrobacter sp. NamE5]TLM86933.1 acyltransferase [Pseudarthrobacter sp. NamE5]
MSVTRTAEAPAPTAGGRQTHYRSSYRPEIQGLRSLAVLMVVSYHVWFGRVSGGVDIFLLISAFLMTLQFTGRHERRERVGLLKHWLHLFRRLLPAAVTVIVATLAASYRFLPRTRWLDLIQQGWASLSYSQNRLLQEQAVDYYANDHSLASPLQHFWSLSIQGQVFILWPLIFALAAWAAQRYRLSYRPLLAYVFFALFLGSLAYSIYFTATNQVQAYFDTGARLWEFALGTLVALILPGLRLSRPTRIIMGWVGLIAMLSCGILLNVQAAFPGIAALWPTLAAALIIAAGQTQSAAGVDRFLSFKPLVKLGGMSYALYLWHWPLLVLGLAWSGKEHAGWLSGSVIILASLLLAHLTTRFIETPWREWKWPETRRRRSVLAIALVVTVAAAPLALWRHHILQSSSISAIGLDDPRYPGARAASNNFNFQPDGRTQLVPTPEVMATEWPEFPEPCTGEGENVNICTNAVEDGTKSIVIMGSSHAHVLNTLVLPIAEKNRWSVTSITKGFCPLTDEMGPGISQECLDFNAEEMQKVLEMKPDLVLTTSTRTFHDSAVSEWLDEGWIREVQRLNEAGIPVLGIRDTPRMPAHTPDCLAENPQAQEICGSSRVVSFSPVSPTDAAADRLPDTRFMDLTRYFCTDDFCPAAIGNVIVYKDSNHVTRSYMMTLAPFFEQEFLAATGWQV